eukprot:GHVT01044083.1.p1 GENE.GHVT01044083.1~~GHVT01044083.1.p1  ORF type:complete len:530 (-),score=9.60 GHVT01044083.1:37-1626(-)
MKTIPRYLPNDLPVKATVILVVIAVICDVIYFWCSSCFVTLSILHHGRNTPSLTCSTQSCVSWYSMNSGASCVTGSADHALRLWNLQTLQVEGELFGKKSGHYEWVTACCFTHNGDVLSGGMDGKLCVWSTNSYTHKARRQHTIGHSKSKQSRLALEAGGVQVEAMCVWPSKMESDVAHIDGKRGQYPRPTREFTASTNSIVCRDFPKGHSASISGLRMDRQSDVAVSSGYDGQLILWDIPSMRAEAHLKAANAAPITSFQWLSSLLVSGDRNGTVAFWDINRPDKPLCCARRIHQGAVSDIAFSPGLPGSQTLSQIDENHATSPSHAPIIFSGGQADGRLCVFDLRAANRPVSSTNMHKGALNRILCTEVGSPGCVCTVGADRMCKISDWQGMGTDLAIKPLRQAELSDSITCGEWVTYRDSRVVFAGTADGNVFCVPLDKLPGADYNTCKEQDFKNSTDLTLPFRSKWGFGATNKGAVNCLQLIGKGVKESPDMLGSHLTPFDGLVAAGDDGHLCYMQFSQENNTPR